MHPEKALKNADLIVTDTWYSMHHTKEERKLRQEIMQKYSLTMDLVNISKKNCLVFIKNKQINWYRKTSNQ